MGNFQHLNDDLLCVIHMTMTGTDPQQHDILDLALVPIDSQFKPIKIPFTAQVKPRFPEAKEHLHYVWKSFKEYQVSGLDYFDAAKRLEMWFETVRRRENKRLQLLGHSVHNKVGFLIDMLGPLTYNYIFSDIVRDIQIAALLVNDRAYIRGNKVEVQKVDLAYLRSHFNAVGAPEVRNEPLTVCTKIAEIYKELLRIQT